MMLIGIVSVAIILSILLSKTSFNSKERVIFMINHILYIAVYIRMWTFPLIEMLKDIDSYLPIKLNKSAHYLNRL